MVWSLGTVVIFLHLTDLIYLINILEGETAGIVFV